MNQSDPQKALQENGNAQLDVLVFLCTDIT